jgi:putative endonuclease
MAERHRRYRLGHHAELLCAWYLRLRGWRILARRYRSPVGEIDIVARRGRLVAFVEVKARSDRMAALESVTERQRTRVRRAAELFVGSHPALAALDFRFDVMVVSPWSLPHHVIDAWRD